MDYVIFMLHFTDDNLRYKKEYSNKMRIVSYDYIWLLSIFLFDYDVIG